VRGAESWRGGEGLQKVSTVQKKKKGKKKKEKNEKKRIKKKTEKRKKEKKRKEKRPSADQDFFFSSFKLIFTVCPARLNEALGRRLDAPQTSLAGGFPRPRSAPPELPVPSLGQLRGSRAGAPASCKTPATARHGVFPRGKARSLPVHRDRYLPGEVGGDTGGPTPGHSGVRSLLLPRRSATSPPKGAGPGRSIPRLWGVPGGKAPFPHRCARERAAPGPAASPCAASGSSPGSFQTICCFCDPSPFLFPLPSSI